MKNSKKCPKCGSTEIIHVVGDGKIGNTSNCVSTGVTFLSAVYIHRYICCDCGFTEEWIDKRDINTVKNSGITKPID